MFEDNITVSTMQESDLDAVAAIELESFTDPWRKKMFATEIKSPGFSTPLVVKVHDSVIGYAILWQVMDEMHIGNLAVKKEFRRQGIASKLLHRILEMAKARKIVKVTLEVRALNEAAITLYHRFGFRKIAIRKNFYTNPIEDAFVMLKDDV